MKEGFAFESPLNRLSRQGGTVVILEATRLRQLSHNCTSSVNEKTISCQIGDEHRRPFLSDLRYDMKHERVRVWQKSFTLQEQKIRKSKK